MAIKKTTARKSTSRTKSKGSGKITSFTMPVSRMAGIFEGGNPNAGQPGQRSTIIYGSQYNKDFSALVSDYDLAQLRGVSRYLYSNLGAAKQAINQMASFSTNRGYRCIFGGQDEEWNTLANQFVNKTWWNNATLRNQSFGKVLSIIVVSVLRDGEAFVVLTEDENNFPKIQCLSAHRIGNRKENETYRGMPIKNGIIYDKYGRQIGIKILGYADDGSDDTIKFAQDIIHVYDPYYFEEGRGTPCLAASIEHWKDYYDIVFYIKRTQKIASTISLKVKNATGTVSTDDEEYASYLSTINSSVSGSAVTGEYVEGSGGEIRYLNATTGEDIDVLQWEHPGGNTQEFLDNTVLRGCFAALEWPMELSWDGSKLKGAPTKMIIANAQRRLEGISEHILLPMWNRVISWVLSKAIKYEFLPYNKEWYNVTPSPVRELTVDEFRNSQADINDLKAGLATYEEIYRKWGMDWQDAVEQRIREQKYIEQRCSEEGINIDRVQSLFPNPINDQPNDTAQVNEDKSTDEKK